MSPLPFVVEPRIAAKLERIGSDEAGYIEIMRKGYLTAGEVAFSQSNSSMDGGLQSVVKLARKVAQTYSIDLKKSYDLVSGAVTGDMPKGSEEYSIEKDFGEDIQNLTQEMLRQESIQRQVRALCLLLYRVDPNIEGDEVNELHPDLVDALSDLYQEEESRSVEKLNDSLKQDVEDGAEKAESAEDLEKK